MKEKGYVQMADAELVARLLANDEGVIRYLFFDRCTPIFDYILHRFYPCQLRKEELISELYLYLRADDWYKLRRFDFRSRLTTWLAVVAVRFFQKKQKGMMDFACQRPLMEGEKSFEPWEKSISKLDVWTAVRKMKNERYRRVVIDLELNDREPKVLAQEMNVTIDNLYNIRHRALQQLMTIMREEEHYV